MSDSGSRDALGAGDLDPEREPSYNFPEQIRRLEVAIAAYRAWRPAA
jgi:hypothetical protein